MEDLKKRTNNWIYKTKKSILDRPSGPVPSIVVVYPTMEGTNYYQDEDKKSAINKKLILKRIGIYRDELTNLQL